MCEEVCLFGGLGVGEGEGEGSQLSVSLFGTALFVKQ